MPLIGELTDYEIFPVSSCAEHIPSMSEHESYKKFLKCNGLENFESGIPFENEERKRLHRLIQINYKLHGDVPGIAIPKNEIKHPGVPSSE